VSLGDERAWGLTAKRHQRFAVVLFTILILIRVRVQRSLWPGFLFALPVQKFDVVCVISCVRVTERRTSGRWGLPAERHSRFGVVLFTVLMPI
jgi:hypothetical protein